MIVQLLARADTSVRALAFTSGRSFGLQHATNRLAFDNFLGGENARRRIELAFKEGFHRRPTLFCVILGFARTLPLLTFAASDAAMRKLTERPVTMNELDDT